MRKKVLEEENTRAIGCGPKNGKSSGNTLRGYEIRVAFCGKQSMPARVRNPKHPFDLNRLS